MEGKRVGGFRTGGELYQIMEVPDHTYGYVWKIYLIPDNPEEEPEQIYPTIYREDAVEVFVQNLIDSNIEYDRNL